MKFRLLNLFCLFCFFTISSLCGRQSGVFAQEKQFPISINGNIQSDILFPEEDVKIGSEGYDETALTNTYFDLNLMSTYINAGARFEFLKYPLPGFEPDFSGWGVPYLYLTGSYKKVKLTVGDFYDQFGSGFIFRAYQERSLGIDNALRGGRLTFEPVKGVNIKALGGKQRRYFEHNDSYILGSDLELNIEQWFEKMQENNTVLLLGGSFITKHEDDETIKVDSIYKLNFPNDVAAFDIRAKLQKGNYSFLLEYANKINDPSSDNNYIYKNGTAWLFSSSYAQRGMSILLQAKRSDNMTFRSKRSDNSVAASFLNHLPPFSMQHSYTLAALYPYATQPGGEWAFQGNFTYNFRRNTKIGGKYGTIIKINASHIRSIDKQFVEQYNGSASSLYGTEGYSSDFFKMGDETYYQDINFSIDKKLTKDFKLNLMYMNLYSNEMIIRQHEGDLRANIFACEGKYQISNKVTLRSELQYLSTKDDEGDWMFGLIEISLLPYLMFTVSDMYNSGESKLHYYKALVTFTYKSHLLQAGYGRSRAGYDCSGGICRRVPASRGFQMSYNYNF